MLAGEGQIGHSSSSSEQRTFMAIAVKPSAETAMARLNPGRPGFAGKSFSEPYNSSTSEIKSASHLILPGVGSFKNAINK